LTFHVIGSTLAGNMGVVEIIQQAQQVQAEQATREKAKAGAAAEKIRLEQEVRTKELQVKSELARQQRNKILKESGALEMLQNIEKEFLKAYKFHGIVSAENGVELVWGDDKYTTIINNRFFNKMFNSYDYSDVSYCHLRVSVDLDNEALTIAGYYEISLTKPEWNDNGEIVERTVANAFLTPGRHHESASPPEHISGSS